MPVPGGQERKNRMLIKPDILSSVSHEVRTQMNAIVAFSYLLNNNRFTSEEKKEFSEQIILSCEQLSYLFDNFLDTAAIDVGSIKQEVSECNAGEILENLSSEFRVLMRKKGKENIRLIHEDTMPGKITVSLDVAKIHRIMNNLFRNALENTNSGFIRFGCFFSDNMITFYIKDSGQYIRECKDLLLSDNPELVLKDQNTCTLMNLMLARNLISSMGGSARIDQNDSNGTSVFVSFNTKESSASKEMSDLDTEVKIAI